MMGLFAGEGFCRGEKGGGHFRSIIVRMGLILAVLGALALAGCGSSDPAATPSSATYTVTYDGNGNTTGAVPAAPANYEQGQAVTVTGNTGNLVKTNYTFAGWNTAADGSGTTYTQNQSFTMGAANVTLYAKWTSVPEYAYVANYGDGTNPGTVSEYTIDATTGALTPITGSPVATGVGPESVTVDPTGKYAYVADRSGGINPGTVSEYTIDATTGALTPITGSPVAAGVGPESVVVDPTGKYAYVANHGGGVSEYTIDAATGALTPITGSPVAAGTNPSSVTVDPTGKYAYVANYGGGVSEYTIDATTGALTPITGSPVAAGFEPHSVIVDPTGKYAYVANGGGGVSEYTIDATTGVLTPITGSPVAGNGESVTVDPTGKYAYVANGGVWEYTIDAMTGALTPITGSSVAAGNVPVSIAITK